MKKKIIALFFSLLFIVAVFTACTDNKTSPDTSDEGTTLSEEKKENENTTSGQEIYATVPTSQSAPAPFFTAFESETTDGKKVTDDIFKGNKVTMVNVWGTFSSPCTKELPDLQKLSESYKDKGLCLIGIVIDTYDYTKKEISEDKLQAAESIIDQTGVKYMNILPSASLNAAKLDSILSVPATYFLNEKGEIIGSEYVGSKSYDEWCDIIDRVLERA